jgi:hypothetical protein
LRRPQTGKVLLADANYSHSTNASPRAALIHLNVQPGLVTADQVLGPVLAAVPVEAAVPVLAAVPVEAVHVMQPDEGPEPDVFGIYRAQLGPELPLRPLGRWGRCGRWGGWSSTPPAGNPTWPFAWRPGTTGCTPTSC